MDIYEALETRISCRAFEDRMIEGDKLQRIQDMIAKANETGNINLRLYGPRGTDKTAIDLQENVFAGPVYHYIACASRPDAVSREKVGYFGEQIVLEATQMELGTCWVLMSFDPDTVRLPMNPGEQFVAIILLGYEMKRMPTQQWLVRAEYRRMDKMLCEAIDSDTSQVPDWFGYGVMAAQIGPSAANLQPTVFCWENGEASAYMPDGFDLQDVDFGIAKYQFEVGSRYAGTWEWGEHGRFLIGN